MNGTSAAAKGGAAPAAVGTSAGGVRVERLRCASLTCADGVRLARFYQQAFECQPLGGERRDGAAFEQLMGVDGGACCLRLALGESVIELLQFDRPGEPYPEGVAASDLRFQHCAIVVRDIDRALQGLARVAGWCAISQGGAQRLPASCGGVRAFKFRDPEGHPLELLEFPDPAPAHWRGGDARRLFLGIDHSAICVADTARSVGFYCALGLTVCAASVNVGAEQQRLDAVPDPRVEVTALAAPVNTPHVELLCYCAPTATVSATAMARGLPTAHSNDVVATRLVFEAQHDGDRARIVTEPRRLNDPDGHQLLLV